MLTPGIGKSRKSIYIYTLLVWVSVCLYPINVKTAELIKYSIFKANDPRKSLWMLKTTKICLQKNVIVRKILEIHEKLFLNRVTCKI